MHRSGTSILSESLDRLGVFTGRKVNIHKEAIFYLNLNKKLLQKCHSYWDTPLNIISTLEDSLALEHLVDISQSEISSFRYKLQYLGGFSHPLVWGWKDPRNILFIPVYLRLFPNAKFLFIVRNGVDVAYSLNTREIGRADRNINSNISVRCRTINRAFRLWEEYMEIYAHFSKFITKQNLLELKYEDVCLDQDTYTSEIYNFINKSDAVQDRLPTKLFDASLSYSFLNRPEPRLFYEKVKDSEYMRRWGYNTIL